MNAKILNPFLAVLILAGCSGEEQVEIPELADVMPILPLPPESRLVDRVGSDEALQLTFQSRQDHAGITAYYRETFSKAPWTVVSDTETPDGAVILYVENDGRPLWVRVARTPGAPGSTVQLSGALVGQSETPADSVPAPSDSVQAG